MSSISEFPIILKKQRKSKSMGYRPISIRLEVYNQIAYYAEETGLALSEIACQLLTAAFEHVELRED